MYKEEFNKHTQLAILNVFLCLSPWVRMCVYILKAEVEILILGNVGFITKIINEKFDYRLQSH